MVFFTGIISYILLRISVAQGSYSISDDELTWVDANQKCKMATPDINYMDMTVSVQSDQYLKYDELWTGYYRAMIGFEYFGCAMNTSIGSSTVIRIENNSPGHCYSACRKHRTIVGLSDHMCYCLDSSTSKMTSESSCNISCPTSARGIACGGTSHLSLYRVNPNVSSITGVYSGINVNCVRLEINKDLLWASCSSHLRVKCEIDSEQARMHYRAQTTGQNNFKWHIANNMCFQNNGRPTTYANVLNGNNASGPSWTGMCRSFVVLKYTEPYRGDINIEYGYLKKTASKLHLKFTDDNGAKKKTLCKSDDAPKSSLQTTETTHGSDTSVPIGVSVAAFLIIVAIIITVVILKRRGKILNKWCVGASSQKPADNTKAVYTGDDDDMHTHEGPSYDKIGELESPKKIDVNKDDSLDNSNYAHTYFVLEEQVKETDTEYDGCAYGNNYSKMESDTDYNTLNMDAHNKRADDTYDTAEKAAMKLKTAYEMSDKFGETGEDAYNHINSNPLKNNKTDNIYGGPSNTENAYGVCRNDMHVEGDDYSHINNIKKESSVPDNHYTTSI